MPLPDLGPTLSVPPPVSKSEENVLIRARRTMLNLKRKEIT